MDNPAECTSIRDRVDELILITGAEGCGKSFLVWQLCHPLFDRKGEIELLYADALSANLQFDVLHKILLRKLDIIDLRSQFAILEDWCRQNGEDHTIAGIQPFLYPALDVKHAPPREYSPQEIEVIYDKLAQIAQRLLSGVQCVVIENYEYFDDNSRTLLKRLIRLCIAAGQRVILTAVQDPNFTADAVDHIALDKLTPEQSDALIRQLIPNISSLAVNLLHQISDGNPRFLVELIRQIRNCYDVQNDLITDHIINEMRNNGMIPDSLENLMLAHYEQLGDMEKQLLKQTAIFGRPFIYDEMRDLFGDLWETHYQEMVLELQRQGLFSTIGFLPTPVFAYVNTIFPESIYRTILLSEKKKLHLVIADYFEKKHSENETKHVAFIAYHYICAGDRKKMIPWCKEAANLYLRLGAYEQCRFFLHKIIENSPYENETCAAALLIADSHLRQANNADAETILTRYKYLKDLVGESHDRFISLYVRWLNNTADFAGIRDFVLQYLSTVADNEIRSQVHIDYIEALVFNNAVDEVESEALPLYRTLSAKHKTAALNKLSGVLAQFYVNQGEYKQALDYYHQKLKYAEKLDDAFSQRIANAGIGIVYARQGRKTLAYRYYQKAIEIAERIGDRNGYAKALMDLGTLHRNAAEHTKALDCYLKCLSIAQHIGNRILESIVTYNIGELHNFLRDFVNARDYVQRSLSISQKIADHTGVSFCYDALGDICFEEHKLDEAEEIYRKNLELQTRIQDHEGIAHTIGNLGNIAKHRDDIDKARELYRKQLELVSEIGDIESMGKARFNLAMLHIDQNNPVAALEDLEQALILFKQCESAYLTELSEEQIQAVREMLR
ncbi:MAG: tetratricopeptide repeat protein [Candidatus Cloacimonetes bacterium]|nr:tetratricopeptide repeat protein [Candidatus Cloacimonadota bacterium]